MNTEERRSLQRQLCKLDHREAENVEPTKTFLPLWTHRQALSPSTVVVRGGRGAGKSALFNLSIKLKSGLAIRDFFGFDDLFEAEDIPEAIWVSAFSQSNPSHPEEGSLQAFAANHDDIELRAFWMAHLLLRLVDEVNVLSSVERDPVVRTIRAVIDEHGISALNEWTPVAVRELGKISAALDRCEKLLDSNSVTAFAAYDHLDRISTLDASIRKRYIKTLLSFWLSLSNRYRRLRAKLFLRDDLFDARHLEFPDATKLRARSASLEWSVEDLYRVVVRHMASIGHGVKAWLDSIPKLELSQSTNGFIPGPMPEAVQKAFVKRLAGELMGKGVKKGYTHRWIPNRLQDAQIRIVPRSILTLMGIASKFAIDRTFRPNSKRLLTPLDLVAALDETSSQRVEEIREEYPLVRRLENLRGEQVLMEPEFAAESLGVPVRDDPLSSLTDGMSVIDELVRLGVLSIRRDGRIDVPDIYRYGFGIKRKGGVRRPK